MSANIISELLFFRLLLDPSLPFFFALIDFRFRNLISPEAEKGHKETKALKDGDGVVEVNDACGDDDNAFDERGDGVCDWGNCWEG